jgi:NitT/TauT family transport system permease protein
VFDEFYISRPLAVWKVLVEWSTTPSFWDDLFVTLWETALGFAIGAVAGTLVAFVLAETRRARAFFTPYINALYGVPKSALAPLFIVWFGVGLTPKVVLSASLVFFLVFYNTLTGLLSVDRGLLNVVKLGGASRLQVWTTLKIPATFPYWVTGAKVALPISLIGAIIGEFISSNQGMGYRILQAGNTFATAQVFAVLIVLSIVSLVMISALTRMENYFLRWRLSSE